MKIKELKNLEKLLFLTKENLRLLEKNENTLASNLLYWSKNGLIIPVKKEAIAEIAAKIIGIEINKLSNIVSPPVCPVATTNIPVIRSKKKAIINPIDHFPRIVDGIKNLVVFSFFIYLIIS